MIGTAAQDRAAPCASGRAHAEPYLIFDLDLLVPDKVAGMSDWKQRDTWACTGAWSLH